MKKYYGLGLALLAAPTLALATQYYCPTHIVAKLSPSSNTTPIQIQIQIQSKTGTAQPFLPFTETPVLNNNKSAKFGIFPFTFFGVYYANEPKSSGGPTGCYYTNPAFYPTFLVLKFNTGGYTPVYGTPNDKWTAGYNPQCSNQYQSGVTPALCPLASSTGHATHRPAR